MNKSPEERMEQMDRRSFWRAVYRCHIEKGVTPTEAAWLSDGALDHYDKRTADGRL